MFETNDYEAFKKNLARANKVKQRIERRLIKSKITDATKFRDFDVEDESDVWSDLLYLGLGVNDVRHFGGIRFEKVKDWGGEGQGNNAGYILKVQFDKESDPVLLKISAYYSSWDVTDYHLGEFTLVEPRQVMVTKYELAVD